jgi:hypothetical protein
MNDLMGAEQALVDAGGTKDVDLIILQGKHGPMIGRVLQRVVTNGAVEAGS